MGTAALGRPAERRSVAIALCTGRAKDHIRLAVIEQDAVDRERLYSILERHGLTLKWKQFERKYLEGTHE